MKLLLDTHTFLWFIEGNSKLSATARLFIDDSANDKFVSVVSLWEIAIKFGLGRLTLTDKFEVLFPNQIIMNGFEQLAIENKHLYEFIKLPQHHNDPFDRLLIAQTIAQKMSVVSVDSAFDDYSVNRLW
ncbi:MAG: type II toxin-antitoxin system VapC family toxin [Acidobacteriota bacterium]